MRNSCCYMLRISTPLRAGYVLFVIHSEHTNDFLQFRHQLPHTVARISRLTGTIGRPLTSLTNLQDTLVDGKTYNHLLFGSSSNLPILVDDLGYRQQDVRQRTLDI